MTYKYPWIYAWISISTAILIIDKLLVAIIITRSSRRHEDILDLQ